MIKNAGIIIDLCKKFIQKKKSTISVRIDFVKFA